MRIVVTAGGGGHFAPALAVIQEMPKDWNVLIIGRKYAFEADKTLSLEFQTAEKLGLPFTSLTTGRFQRKFTRNTLSSLLKTPVGFAQAVRVLKRYKPDVVVSFGGYVSVPVVLAASLLRIPIVLHEQTLHAGLANKVVAPFADRICVSWDVSLKHFPKSKTIVTGSPIRKDFLEALKHKSSVNKMPMIYITGGSGGAHAINVLIEDCLDRLLEKYTVVHQTGDAQKFGDYQRLRAKKESLSPELQKRYTLTKFVEPAQVVEYMKQADLVIARSGINTVIELLLLGKPALLIPLIYGQKGEQLANAQLIARTGLAEIADQNTLTSDTLYTRAEKMLSEKAKYTSHAERARALVHLDATQRIIDNITYATQQKSSQKT